MQVLEGSAGGPARRGAERGRPRPRHRPRRTGWPAPTPTRPSPDWLAEHVRLADAGADVVVGTVEPDPAELDQLASASGVPHDPRADHPHVHGANLGFTLAAYVRAGGFPGAPRTRTSSSYGGPGRWACGCGPPTCTG